MRLNLGCGSNPLPGYHNVDHFEATGTDEVVDLEAFPWPWSDECVDDVVLNHVLEHLGQMPRVFLRIMQELYRVCRHGARIEVNVPHPRHDSFLGDPTHVRAITPQMLQLFDRSLNERWARDHTSNTPLALQAKVDFVLESLNYSLDEPYFGRLQRGELTTQQLDELVRTANNVASEIRMVLRVRKSTR